MNQIADMILVGLAGAFAITTLGTALMNPRACRGCRHDLLRCDAAQVQSGHVKAPLLDGRLVRQGLPVWLGLSGGWQAAQGSRPGLRAHVDQKQSSPSR